MSYGLKQIITTLTEVSDDVLRQQFYEIKPSDYASHLVGDSKWADSILFSQVYSTGGDFETGIIDTGASTVSPAETDIEMDSITTYIATWVKQANWTYVQLEQGLTRRHIDIIEEKLISLKKNWDLGIQKSCFLGLKGNSNFPGLLNHPKVKKDTTTVEKPFSDDSMDFSKLQKLISKIIVAYRKNCSSTTLPNRLIVPDSDYYGLISPATESNVLYSKLDMLENSFKKAVGGDFKILPLLYANKDELKEVIANQTKDRYVLYRYDKDCVRRDIPVDLTARPIGTYDNFNMVQILYGQFSGITIRRPDTIMYFEPQN